MRKTTIETNARGDSVIELKRVFTVLASDVGAAITLAEELDNRFSRRSLVPTLIAFIEGTTFQLASVCVASAPLEVRIFSADEFATLREEKGHHQCFKSRIKTALRCFAKIHDTTFEPQFDDVWQALVNANNIRDRITHPKSMSALNVSDSNTRELAAASQWYQRTVEALQEACETADAAR